MKVNFIDQQKDFYRPWVKFYGKDTPPNLEYSDKTMFEYSMILQRNILITML